MLEPQSRQKFHNQTSLELIEQLLSVFRKRKTTRQFSGEHVDLDIILNAIAIAGTAPSGANKQPWQFAVISEQETKMKIRKQAEAEEYRFYHERAPEKWLNDLKPLHTDSNKAFITEASYLIPIFFKNYELDESNKKAHNYYVKESVGLATGFLLAALHMVGLSTLTYTPSNSRFMVKLLNRSENEHVFMVLAVGRPAKDAQVPVLKKKPLSQIVDIYKNINEREIDHS
ncbi:MAG: nitroreductase family protein [Bdellovibrionales bacterium]|nr:nitroreductase family protein [Bdellovibrionales bacterium]